MNNEQNSLEQAQYKEALLKYAQTFNLKKNKTFTEQQLSEEKRYYVIYARKSTEDDKRQVQSIDDQIDHCMKYAKANNLNLVADPIREEKSAKIAGKRERFNEMLTRLKKGDLYNSVLSWHPDRLSRNMKESGEILDMLDNDIIIDLRFPSYPFNNDAAGKMTLSILFAMAKEFSDKLSEDTRRGIGKKVREGKYTGTAKKGYFKNEDDYFRRDEDKFEIYSQAWKDYRQGKTQSQIIESLNDKGEKMDTNSMSNYFQDPFAAGIYCYGDEIVDLTTVDPKFKSMVSPKDFILSLKVNRGTPRGWHISDEFRPFNEFIICNDCGNPMTSGVSKGKGGRYLSVTCGNRKCKENRRTNGVKPIANTIRGENILDFVINSIDNFLKVDEITYKKAKTSYFEEKNMIVKEAVRDITNLKGKKSKLESKSKLISDKFLEVNNQDINKRLKDDLSIILAEIRTIENNIYTLELKKSEYEFQMESEFPNYQTFLNFFKELTGTIQTTDNAYLVDQLVKLMFLNIKVDGKNVVGYMLQETFDSFENLNFLSGVSYGMMFETLLIELLPP